MRRTVRSESGRTCGKYKRVSQTATRPPTGLLSRERVGAVGRRNPLSRYGALFRQRSFTAFLTAGALQFAAPSAVLVVLLYCIAFAYPAGERTTYGALALALLGLSSTLPTLAAAFFSGALADRFDRAALMKVVNLVSLLATAGLASDLVFLPSGRVPIPGPAGFYLPVWVLLLYPGWAAVAATTTLFRPAFNASVPRLVSAKDLPTANGTIYAIAGVVSALGSIVVGVVLTFAAPAYALSVAFLLFFATQVALLFVRTDLSVSRRGPVRSVLKEATEGYSYLARRRGLLQITVAALVTNFLSAVALVELALYVASWLNLSEGIWYGAIVATSTVGVAAGFMIAPRLRFEARAGRVIIVFTLAMGLAILALGLVHSIWLALPIVFVYGLMPGMITTVFLSTIQATVPDEMMGRVFSADEVGSMSLIPVGQYTGGLLTLSVGVQGTYLGAGGAIIVFGLIMVASFGSLRRLGYRPAEASSPTG
ncbi:MAG TPA: MFS transporter [Thermoplasmata archaeon]